jgi:hypothetical protein
MGASLICNRARFPAARFYLGIGHANIAIIHLLRITPIDRMEQVKRKGFRKFCDKAGCGRARKPCIDLDSMGAWSLGLSKRSDPRRFP